MVGPQRATSPATPRRCQASRATWAACAAALLLAACASKPPLAERDGPEARPPGGLEDVPDAEPRLEAIRPGGPNKPYAVGGVTYRPLAPDAALKESGLASWYGRKFHGRSTASGEPYDMYAMTAAHRTLPIPSYVRVRNPRNQREVVVRVNDRGPFVDDRVIDLSYTAALKLGVLGGVAPVVLERITPEDIRTGLWKRDRSLPPPPLPTEEDPLMALVNASGAATAAAPAPPGTAPGWWLQLGAFRQRDGADALQQRVQREAEAVAPAVSVAEDREVYRVHAGPYPSRGEALAAAEKLRALLALVPLLVSRP